MNQILVDLPNPSRWRSTLPVAVAVLALVSSVTPLSGMQGPNDPPGTNIAKTSLPPRAMLRIGTDQLRMNRSRHGSGVLARWQVRRCGGRQFPPSGGRDLRCADRPGGSSKSSCRAIRQVLSSRSRSRRTVRS